MERSTMHFSWEDPRFRLGHGFNRKLSTFTRGYIESYSSRIRCSGNPPLADPFIPHISCCRPKRAPLDGGCHGALNQHGWRIHVFFLMEDPKWGSEVTMFVSILSHGHPWRLDDFGYPHDLGNLHTVVHTLDGRNPAPPLMVETWNPRNHGKPPRNTGCRISPPPISGDLSDLIHISNTVPFFEDHPTLSLVSTVAGWWLTYPSEKWWSSSVGIIIPNIYMEKKCSKPPTSYRL